MAPLATPSFDPQVAFIPGLQFVTVNVIVGPHDHTFCR